MGEYIVELAYVRNQSAEHDMRPVSEQERARPRLRAVPDLTSSPRPALPRRPSRRAVVRARVWGVPLSTADERDGRPSEWAPIDPRIAEAVRLLGGV